MDASSDEEDVPFRNLGPEEMDKLVQLQDLTGIEDLQVCRGLLESQNWDLEATAWQHLNLGHPTADRGANINEASSASLSSSSSTSSNSSSSSSSNSMIVTSSRALYNLVSYLFYAVSIPFRTALSFFLPSAIYRILPFSSSSSSSAPAVSPGVDVATFRSNFRNRYESSDDYELPYCLGSYNQILENAKKDLKFLLIYLHSPGHQDTDRFCRQTLKSAEFRDFIERRRSELLLWGCSVETSEGYKVSQACKETSYPFVGVIVLRQNKMMIVGRIEGFVNGRELVETLEAVIRDNEAFVVAARADRDERNLAQTLRMEQDAAFQESLRQDQERERKKREEEERKKREEEDRKLAIQRIAERKNRIRKLKIDLAEFIPDEPQDSDPETVRLVIKLPEGQRLERKFLTSDSLRSLFYYVFCHPDSPDEFDVTKNFPRQVLKCRPSFVEDVIEKNATLRDVMREEEGILTLKEAGLGRSTVLFVNDLEA